MISVLLCKETQVASLVTNFLLCSLFFKRGMDTLGGKSLRKRIYFLDRGLSTAPEINNREPWLFIKYYMFLTENDVYVGY